MVEQIQEWGEETNPCERIWRYICRYSALREGDQTLLKCGPQVRVPSPERTGWIGGERGTPQWWHLTDTPQSGDQGHKRIRVERTALTGCDEKGNYPLWSSSYKPTSPEKQQESIRQTSRGTVCTFLPSPPPSHWGRSNQESLNDPPCQEHLEETWWLCVMWGQDRSWCSRKAWG